MNMRSVVGWLALAALAGCGGGGAGGGESRGPGVAAIDAAIKGEGVSPPARLPVRGLAEYNGYMRADLPTGADGARLQYLGDMTLEVNFGAAFDQIRGQATGFEAKNGTPLTGALAIRKGNIYRATDPDAAYSFDGTVKGTLAKGARPYVIDASIEGEFLGQGQKAVSGLLFGDVTGPEGQDIFDGTFAGTRRAK